MANFSSSCAGDSSDHPQPMSIESKTPRLVLVRTAGLNLRISGLHCYHSDNHPVIEALVQIVHTSGTSFTHSSARRRGTFKYPFTFSRGRENHEKILPHRTGRPPPAAQKKLTILEPRASDGPPPIHSLPFLLLVLSFVEREW